MEEQHASLQSPHRAPVTRPMVLRLLAIGVVAAGIGILIGLEIPWFRPQPRSRRTRSTRSITS